LSVVDSSGWIEFLRGTDDGRRFIPALRAANLVVPTIVIVEVRRWWLSAPQRVGDLEDAMDLLSRGRIIPLDAHLARAASELGIRYRLPLADSIVYATAQSFGLEVWTQDADFDGLPGVRYFTKTP